LRESRKDLGLAGLDWAKSSQDLIKEINHNFNSNIDGYNFDFFNPNPNVHIKENSLVYTVAALEQTGSNFATFVDYLIKQKPNICINLEPIAELLDENKLVDKLSIKYFRKRNYLSGYLNHLKNLESNGIIKIIDKRRIYSGSYFIEGHSLVVWKPL
jgi:hypothetical protein